MVIVIVNDGMPDWLLTNCLKELTNNCLWGCWLLNSCALSHRTGDLQEEKRRPTSHPTDRSKNANTAIRFKRYPLCRPQRRSRK